MAAKENAQYKNSVFVDLFYEDEKAEENEASLYNALHEEPLPEGTKIEKFRVEDVLFMNFKNDISFGVEGRVMVFGEHQSTVNENMPLRSLMYIARAYESIVSVRNRYKKGKVKLPKPEFFTFYNGEQEWAKEKILKLSDSYKVEDDDPMLELKVKMININPEENHEVLEKCPILKEYSLFVSKVRELIQKGDAEAYKHAIQSCINQGILAEYLKKKGSEVVNMLVAEYDYDMDIEVQREEAYQDGERNLLKHLVEKKLSKGYTAEEISDMLEESLEKIEKIMKELS